MANQVSKITLTFDAPDTTKTSSKISQNKDVHSGVLIAMKVKTSDWVSADTVTVAVNDKDGDAMYTETGIGKDTTVYKYPSDKPPLVEQETITATMSGTGPGAGGGTVEVSLFYLKEK
jgi:hypothetical protein